MATSVNPAEDNISAQRMGKIALFDMDGSLANFDDAMRNGLEAMRAPQEPPIPDDLWDMEKMPHIAERMRLIKSEPSWWRKLGRIDEGFQVMTWAREIGYHIDILTKGPAAHPMGWAEKMQWCQDHVEKPFDTHITQNKGLVYGTMLYDDFPDYVLAWLEHRPRGLVIMPYTRSNEEFCHPQVLRWDGTNGGMVRFAMRQAFLREPGQPLILPEF